MSADGNINIQVAAEGVDDAADDLGDTALGGDGDGGDGDGDGGGGLGTAIRGGLLGGVLASALGPLLDVLSPMLKVLQAFLAPVATMLLRLLSPVLRFFIRLLPAWMNFIDALPSSVSELKTAIGKLPGAIWNFMQRLPGLIWSFVKGLPGLIWDAVQWAQRIGNEVWRFISAGADWIKEGAVNIAEELSKVLGGAAEEAEEAGRRSFIPPLAPDPRRFPGVGVLAAGSAAGTVGTASQNLDEVTDAIRNNTPETRIQFEGGLATFVENAERDVNLDFP